MLSASGSLFQGKEVCFGHALPSQFTNVLCMCLQTGQCRNWGDGSPEQTNVVSPVDVSLIKHSYSSHNV